jgi:hypothetical protein
MVPCKGAATAATGQAARAGPPTPLDAVVEGGSPMLDVLFLGAIVGFLALSWGLVVLCDRLY